MITFTAEPGIPTPQGLSCERIMIEAMDGSRMVITPVGGACIDPGLLIQNFFGTHASTHIPK